MKLKKSQKKRIKNIVLWLTFINVLKYSLMFFIDLYLSIQNKIVLFSLDYGIGDQVCMTGLANYLAVNKNYKVIVASDYHELYEGNDDIFYNIKYKELSRIKKKIISIFFHAFKGGRVIGFYSKKGISEICKEEGFERASLTKIHCYDFYKRLKLDLGNVKPVIKFTDEEKIRLKEKFSYLPKTYSIIMPNSNLNYTPNKSWKFDRFQELVNLYEGLNWVQTGAKNERLLENAIDLTGKTNNIKELAYLISKAQFIVSTEGLLNHLSAAFDTTSIVVFSGFHHKEIATYQNTIAITREPQTECAPCFLTTPCPRVKKYCTDDITIEMVSNAIKTILE